MPYPNDNRLNVVLMQTSASADGSGKFPFTERIISGSNLFILTDANGNLTGSTSIPGGSFTNLTVTGALTASIISASNAITSAAATFAGPVTMSSALSASGGIITSTISASSNVYISGSLTVVGNIIGTIDSASAILITDTPTTAATYYATFVDGTSGVRSLRTDSSTLTWNPNTNKIQIGSGGVGNLEVAPQGGGAALKAYATNTTLASLEVGGGSYESASFFVNSPSEFQIKAGSYPDASVSSSLPFKLTSATQATSWNNGALSVNGGVGIGKNLYVSGSLNVIGNVVLGDTVTDTIQITGSTLLTGSFSVVGASTFSGLVSASAGLTASAIQDAGTLTVVGNSILSTVFATNVTASNISASGNISSSNEYIAGTLTVIGNSTLSTVFATNITASNISASGNIIGNNGTFAGDVAVNGGDITTTSGTATLFNTNATSVTIGGGATNTVLLGNGTGVVKTAGDFVLGINNAIKDTSGILGLTVSSSLTTVAGDLRVGGNDIQDNSGVNNLTLSSTRVNVPLTTQAIDWTTGALTVAGGVGIGKNLYVSGSTFLYGDLTIFGTGSIVNISSSTVIIGDNRIQLNAGVPIQRYAGIDVFDSGSGTFTNNVTSSLLWDGLNDYWVLVSANSSSGAPLTQSSAIMIGGPTGSFGGESLLTVNYIPKVQSSGRNLQNSGLSDNGTTLSYAGTGISASQVTSSQLIVQYTGSITYATGVYITYTTGSFTTLTITTGSSPGLGAQVPSSPTANGLAGQINVDNNFIYVYTNQVWKRVPLSTWTA